MTQGLRTLRALGAALTLLVSGLSGCTHPEKKPVNPPPRRSPVGPATPGGGMGMPATPSAIRPGMPNTGLPSVMPTGTTSSFGSGNRDSMMNPSVAPQAGYQPAMMVPPSPVNPANMSLQPSMPPPTAQPSTNFQSRGQADNDHRMAAVLLPSGMPGAGSIPMRAGSLPLGLPPETELSPPSPPSGNPAWGATTGLVQPPSSTFAPIAPTPPSNMGK